MVIHLYKTSTPSTRNGTVDSQVKSNPQNNLIYGQRRCGKGHNARGIITARHRGGGHKRLYQYDPNRNAYICLIHYGDGEKRYILHPRGAIIGDTIVSYEQMVPSLNRLQKREIGHIKITFREVRLISKTASNGTSGECWGEPESLGRAGSKRWLGVL
ncbi:hypothetical protein H5410_001529 [Solanum commersonii]|uniref:Large ribosomal subunit protein uL2 RNA-binding domain-containing protein n=1 Tax=Solanum commersonii TaxID=4109 RepID=A0A9J6AZF4_SOLCO|nr:hypothetical protein H5410_001529 [Solanum commersonii]